MTPADQDQAIIIGSGQGGTPLAAELAAAGWRTALIPYTALRDAIFAHPTFAESLNNLFTHFV